MKIKIEVRTEWEISDEKCQHFTHFCRHETDKISSVADFRYK